MVDKRKEDIKQAIESCKLKLHTIMPHLSDEKTALNETFNKLLIEKAVLRDKLMKNNTKSFLSKFIKKVCSSKKELICDYFK